MKKEVSPGLIGAIAVAVVLIIVFFAYKKFGGDPTTPTATPEQVKAVAKMRSSVMAPGVHRDANGHFVDAQGNPVEMSVAPTRSGN